MLSLYQKDNKYKIVSGNQYEYLRSGYNSKKSIGTKKSIEA